MTNSRGREILVRVLSYVGAALLFILGLGCLVHPVLTVLSGAAGLLLMPPTRKWLETRLPFRLSNEARKWAIGVLTLAFLGGIGHYADKEKPALAAAHKVNPSQTPDPGNKIDSFQIFLTQAENPKIKIDSSYTLLGKATALAGSDEQRAQCTTTREKVLERQASEYMHTKSYGKALPIYTLLLEKRPDDTLLLFDRALCYSKEGQPEAAVSDLKAAMDKGSVRADSLHDKVNPLRKRFVGYETLCCDGSTSSARGRGACSHHGGVCDWNNPVYIEERRY